MRSFPGSDLSVAISSTTFPRAIRDSGQSARSSVYQAGSADQTSAPLTVRALSADMAIGVTPSTKREAIGRKLSYRVQITNKGPDPAQTVSVANELPSRVKLVSVGSGAHCSGKTRITCSLGEMAPGSVQQIRLTVRARHAGTVEDIAQVTASSPTDPNLANNRAKATVEIIGKPSVRIIPIGVVCPTAGAPAEISVTGRARAGVRKVVIQLDGRTVNTYTSGRKRRNRVFIHASVSVSRLSAGQTYTVTAVLTDKLGQTARVHATLRMCSGVASESLAEGSAKRYLMDVSSS